LIGAQKELNSFADSLKVVITNCYFAAIKLSISFSFLASHLLIKTRSSFPAFASNYSKKMHFGSSIDWKIIVQLG